jgi:hypothetical protein
VRRRGTAVRGTRLARPTDEVDRGAPLAARHGITYWCPRDHDTVVIFSVDAETPAEWDCSQCGDPASTDRGVALPPGRPRWFPRTPYEFLMMRRTPEDGERLLNEALAKLQEGRRGRVKR